MGMFSFLSPVTDVVGGLIGGDVGEIISNPLKAIEKPFRTGRTGAINEAKKVGLEQVDLNREMLELFRPLIEQGGQALTEFGVMADDIAPLDFSQAFQQAQSSPVLQGLMQNRGREVESALAARGLRRSGKGISEQANVMNDAVLTLANQIFGEQQRAQQLGLNTKLNQATVGLGQGGAASGAIQGIGQGLGMGAQASADAASKREQLIGGLIQGGASALPALLSDRRMKENIVKIGRMNNGLNLYRYNYKGDGTPFYGAMAQEVQEKYPQAVKEIDGLLHVNYGAM